MNWRWAFYFLAQNSLGQTVGPNSLWQTQRQKPKRSESSVSNAPKIHGRVWKKFDGSRARGATPSPRSGLGPIFAGGAYTRREMGRASPAVRVGKAGRCNAS